MIGKTAAATVLAVSVLGLTGGTPAYARTQQPPENTNTINTTKFYYSTTIGSTIDPNSAVRSNPYAEQGRTYWYTTALDSATINCYEHATRKSDGHVSTDVWYHIIQIKDPSHGTLTDAWSWGGNVNTPHDPPAGLPNC